MAAAIYNASILSGDRRTPREVADVAGVTEAAIRNRYQELAERLDVDIALQRIATEALPGRFRQRTGRAGTRRPFG